MREAICFSTFYLGGFSMYTVLEVMRSNPDFGTLDLLNYFERELEISENVKVLKNEVAQATRVRQELRVLRAQRLDAEESLKYAMSAIEADVYMEYPPRQGSDAQRETLRLKLQKESNEYQDAKKTFRDAAAKVLEKEDEMEVIETECKNARRMIELFKSYSAFIKEMKGL